MRPDAARPECPTRGFLPWRFSYAGPRSTWRCLWGAGIRKPSQTSAYTSLKLQFSLCVPSHQCGPLSAQIPIAEHAARRGPARVPNARFPPLEVFVRRPPEYVALSVGGRHPKTFTKRESADVGLMSASAGCGLFALRARSSVRISGCGDACPVKRVPKLGSLQQPAATSRGNAALVQARCNGPR
jgi:hypothetical protein